MKPVIKLMLASPHKLMTDGLHVLFQRDSQFSVIGEVADSPTIADVVRRKKPDVVVLDLLVQALNGLSVARQIKRYAPGTRIVVLSMCTDEAYVSQVLESGASAYVLKSENFTGLVHAMHEVTAGRQYLSPELNPGAIKDRQQNASGRRADRFDKLTPRERQVLQLAAEGRTSAQIAVRLGISRRTAETHRSNIYKKLLVQSHTDLIAFALRRGLVTRDM
jgi:DNA-binding NarL/FixJ family response regulator